MMKLYYSPSSPFTRKVRILAHEIGIIDQIELIPTVVSAVQPNLEFAGKNPLMKLPTLTTDDGVTLFDSPVICQYIDSLHGGAKFVPEAGPARWRALRLEALADGMTEAGILSRNESLARPEDKRWRPWIDGQKEKILQGLDAIERDTEQLDGPITIGQIALGCSLGWMTFRNFPEGARDGRPKLFAWYDRFATRPSLLATAPV